MTKLTKLFLSISAILLAINLGPSVQNRVTTAHAHFTPQPPLIRPLYYFVQTSVNHNEPNGPPSSIGRLDEVGEDERIFDEDSKFHQFEENVPITPSYGDTGDDPEDLPLVDDLSRYLWPDVPLIKKKPLHVHHGRGRHALAQLTYDDYVSQMQNSGRKRLDVDGLQLDVQGYRDGYGEGWDGDEYWLTDAEIYHSKGYQKYRKHLKKSAKALKKSLPVIKWFQKFMEKKAVKYDVIAPWR